jgi:hypothetical protein
MTAAYRQLEYEKDKASSACERRLKRTPCLKRPWQNWKEYEPQRGSDNRSDPGRCERHAWMVRFPPTFIGLASVARWFCSFRDWRDLLVFLAVVSRPRTGTTSALFGVGIG